MRNNALAVPQVAVLDGAQGKFVYVAGKDKDGKDIAGARARSRWATGSTSDGANLWIVESGLKAGDTVIVDGVAKLQSGRADRAGRRSAGGAGRRPLRQGCARAKDGAKAAAAAKS